MNFTNVANDSQVPRSTVYEYFEILRDTLVLHEVPAWKKSKQRKPIVSSKFYFFDVGVVSFLQGREVAAGTPEFGHAFESFLMQELVAYRDYVSGDALSHWRSTSGFEVDFVIGDHTAVEVKAKPSIAANDIKSLRALAEERRLKRLVCVTMERTRREVDGIALLPWRDFVAALWDGEFA